MNDVIGDWTQERAVIENYVTFVFEKAISFISSSVELKTWPYSQTIPKQALEDKTENFKFLYVSLKFKNLISPFWPLKVSLGLISEIIKRASFNGT